MNQITCPKCGTVINLDESDYEGIVRQVRDDQFAHEVEERVASLRREHEQALELARSQAKAELAKEQNEQGVPARSEAAAVSECRRPRRARGCRRRAASPQGERAGALRSSCV